MKEKLVKKLTLLWVISYLVFGACSSAYVIDVTLTTGVYPIKMGSGHQILTFAVTLLYFLPLIILIHRHAKAANMRKHVLISRFVMIVLIVWLTLSTVLMITGG